MCPISIEKLYEKKGKGNLLYSRQASIESKLALLASASFLWCWVLSSPPELLAFLFCSGLVLFHLNYSADLNILCDTYITSWCVVLVRDRPCGMNSCFVLKDKWADGLEITSTQHGYWVTGCCLCCGLNDSSIHYHAMCPYWHYHNDNFTVIISLSLLSMKYQNDIYWTFSDIGKFTDISQSN